MLFLLDLNVKLIAMGDRCKLFIGHLKGQNSLLVNLILHIHILDISVFFGQNTVLFRYLLLLVENLLLKDCCKF